MMAVTPSYQRTLHLALGHCQEKQGNWRAEKTYRTALQLRPNSAPLRNALAQFLMLGRNPEEAAKVIEQGLDSNPDDVVLLLNLAEALLRQQLTRPSDQRDWTDFDTAFKRADSRLQRESAGREFALVQLHAERLAATPDWTRSPRTSRRPSESPARRGARDPVGRVPVRPGSGGPSPAGPGTSLGPRSRGRPGKSPHRAGPAPERPGPGPRGAGPAPERPEQGPLGRPGRCLEDALPALPVPWRSEHDPRRSSPNGNDSCPTMRGRSSPCSRWRSGRTMRKRSPKGSLSSTRTRVRTPARTRMKTPAAISTSSSETWRKPGLSSGRNPSRGRKPRLRARIPRPASTGPGSRHAARGSQCLG